MSVNPHSHPPLSMRPSSRASSRGSIRSPSPLEDQVGLRSQMSALKHEIRHKQAQFNNLETTLLRGPRPLPPPSPTTSDFQISGMSFQRRASSEALATRDSLSGSMQSMNGQTMSTQENIKEGVPSVFGVSNVSGVAKRSGSPTRTLSRIPVSSVGLARALAEEPSGSRSSERDMTMSELSVSTDIANTTSSSLLLPPSPNRSLNRRSLAAGGTTKVLADLQAGVMNARNALENTKSQLRLSQRTVAQLTRQVEDMRDGRERLRLENEGLNNVVARKERLLQEVLERARKAEAEAQQLKVQLKSETANTKRTVKDMEAQLAESTAISNRSEREYLTLKDSIKELSSQWQKDLTTLKADFKEREDNWKRQIEDTGLKYRSLMKLVQAAQTERARVENLKAEKKKLDLEFEQEFRDELKSLSEAIEKSNRDSESSSQIAAHVHGELDRIHRLITASGRLPS